MTMKRGPKRLTVRGVPCIREGEPMALNGGLWDTYRPVSDDDGRIFERDAKTGRVLRTR